MGSALHNVVCRLSTLTGLANCRKAEHHGWAVERSRSGMSDGLPDQSNLEQGYE